MDNIPFLCVWNIAILEITQLNERYFYMAVWGLCVPQVSVSSLSPFFQLYAMCNTISVAIAQVSFHLLQFKTQLYPAAM